MIWWPVVLAVLLHIAPRVVQAWRWGYLLRPVKTRMRVLLHAITRTGTVRVLSSQAVAWSESPTA